MPRLNIRYFSDIHLEFMKDNAIKKIMKNIQTNAKDQICILPGDIGYPQSEKYNNFMKFISANFVKTFVIPGNHEYYNNVHTMDKTKEYMKNYFSKFDNITFLDNNYEYYQDHCFIGTTLWSKITNPTYEINDVYNIPNFDYLKYNRLNMLSVDFLDTCLENEKNCVVITHHIPSNKFIDKKYLTSKMIPYNQWFYCDLDDLIKKHEKKIKCWFYGHTHTPSESYINDILFLCNPIGYPNENSKIDWNKTYILSDDK